MKAGPVVSYHSTAEEEAVLFHVEFSSDLKEFGAHLEAEEKLVSLKQTTTCIPAKHADMFGEFRSTYSLVVHAITDCTDV